MAALRSKAQEIKARKFQGFCPIVVLVQALNFKGSKEYSSTTHKTQNIGQTLTRVYPFVTTNLLHSQNREQRKLNVKKEDEKDEQLDEQTRKGSPSPVSSYY